MHCGRLRYRERLLPSCRRGMVLDSLNPRDKRLTQPLVTEDPSGHRHRMQQFPAPDRASFLKTFEFLKRPPKLLVSGAVTKVDMTLNVVK
jgi:hypothetical protein